MDNDVALIRLISALNIRVVRVPELTAASILLEDDSLMLIATDLTARDRQLVLDAALAHVIAES